jgi:uracil phosphoribosyltransferase
VPVRIVDHPLAQDALLTLRDARTRPDEFRRAAARISIVLAAEALRDLPSAEAAVDTPIGRAAGRTLAGDIVVVPVLRAGLGMLDAVLTLVPGARVGHLGLERDEITAVASRYYSRLPGPIDGSYVLLVDPMLATGGSAAAALDVLHAAGARNVRLVCIVAAPEGVALVQERHPEVTIYTPAVDAGLNARKYIVPGLGDFGDRLFGT